MEEIHDGAGLVKYDLLGLKNIQIIRKTCEYANIPYPKSHTLDWNDMDVWEDITTSPAGIFQFESSYAFGLLKDYKATCINDLSLVNASLRPSGASYRDRLLAREYNKNPSALIDDLLKDNHGFLVFQEDTIKFLQNICGLSGSDADNVRRAIGRKQEDRLQAALPQILDGYCKISDQPREIAEQEAQSFLKIIEDSARYQFGFNHSTGYSMIGYTCAYLRYYYPEEFIAAYLNCAGNADDIVSGTELAKIKGVTIHGIRFGKSIAEYVVDKETHSIYKGISSIKYCNETIANELYTLSQNNTYNDFVALLNDINEQTSVDSRQLRILTTLNFFSDYGSNRRLLQIIEMYDALYSRKQIKKSDIDKLGINLEYFQGCYDKETDKLYKDLHMDIYINRVAETIEDKPLSIKEQIKYEQEYLEYIVYTNPKAPRDMYYVVECKFYKDKTKPYLQLYNLQMGDYLKTKITSGKSFIENPFKAENVIHVKEFAERNKMKKINGEWTKTEDKEKIVKKWDVY
jgi:DNA polymerase-3 subunit alpha